MEKKKEEKQSFSLAAYANHIFVDGLSGMALGLFATLLVGTILEQIAGLLPEGIAYYLIMIATVAKKMTGFGIGVGVAVKYKQSPLVTVSAGASGMVGAVSSQILKKTLLVDGQFIIAGVGEPLGAFVAAFVACELGKLVSGKTKVDILVTPLTSLISGSLIGILLGAPVSSLMTAIGQMINWGAEQQPFLMGIVVSVLMGMALTLPISSAAIGISLKLSGIAAGAAAIGCAANMVGFAVASYRENKLGGLVAQGLGTSMLQMPNIVKKPIIWLPAIITSAVLGPVSTCLFHMVNNATGSGMGTCGLVGQIMAYSSMTSAGTSPVVTLLEIALMHFVAPSVLALVISEIMRKKNWIKEGDMKLSAN